jgi:hypothetical protein
LNVPGYRFDGLAKQIERSSTTAIKKTLVYLV